VDPHGIGDAMPPFGAILDETALWNLIDFIVPTLMRKGSAMVVITGFSPRDLDWNAATAS
jgi:hypothetical protein